MNEITFKYFCNKFAENIDEDTFNEVEQRAKRKRDYIINRFGDSNGARLTNEYMLGLMRDELTQLMAERITEVSFNIGLKRRCNNGRTVTAYCS